MADSPLLTKSKAFALEIIHICNEIKRSQKENIMTNQLVRSGTSIGANIREACQKKTNTEWCWSFSAWEADSKIKMQGSGGALLAAGLDGSNTLICSHREQM